MMTADAPSIPAATLSESEADRLLTVDRGNVAALIAKAGRRLEAGDNRAAQAFYSAALRAFASRPDRSLNQSIRHAEQALAWLGEEFKRHLIKSLEAAGFPDERMHPRFRRSLDYMLGKDQRPAEYRAYPQKPLTYYYPDTDYCMFADVSKSGWVKDLEKQFPVFREEAMALLADHDGFTPYMTADRSRPQTDHHGLLENPNWSKLHLWSNGAPVEAHVRRCPQLFSAIVEHVPLCHLGPRAPSIMLSLLRPGARIPPHAGMLNTRLICHLPLVVPPECGFRVGSKTIAWQEGKVIAFDDTVEHEAWNDSAFDRLVVIFDIWRPEITQAEREQITALFAAVDAYR
jgi:hypothetical protein